MNYQDFEYSPDLFTFSFPTIFQGTDAIVTVTAHEGHYAVVIRKNLVAQLKLVEDYHTWVIAKGELNDYDLVNEIGQRIEAKRSSARCA